MNRHFNSHATDPTVPHGWTLLEQSGVRRQRWKRILPRLTRAFLSPSPRDSDAGEIVARLPASIAIETFERDPSAVAATLRLFELGNSPEVFPAYADI